MLSTLADSSAATRAEIGSYLRLLWNVAPPLHSVKTVDVQEQLAPFLSPRGLHLPDAPRGLDPAATSAWYRAAAAHAAAHLVFSRHLFEREGTPPITQALVGVLEDARVESLACRQFPGLRRLWATWHTASSEDGDGFEALLLRLSRGLIDPGYEDPHPWVRKGRERFFLDAEGQVLASTQPQAVRRLASALGHDLGQMRMAFNPRLYRPGPSYRDDNRCLWQSTADQAVQPEPVSTPHDSHEDVARAALDHMVHRYAEWDHRISRARPNWCAVHEVPLPQAPTMQPGAPAPADLRAALQATRIRPTSPATQCDGDELDLDAAVEAVIDLRMHAPSDLRIHQRRISPPLATAVMVLVDSSASSAQAGGASDSNLQLQKAQAAALAASVSALQGWKLAIQSFSSSGRESVQVGRVLDFDEPWSDIARRRMAAVSAQCSTRLGAALRHATRVLTQQPAQRRVLIVLGDADPHDIDIHDARYLPEDARHAVQTAALMGVDVIGLLHPSVDASMAQRIFGAGRWAVVRGAAGMAAALQRSLRA